MRAFLAAQNAQTALYLTCVVELGIYYFWVDEPPRATATTTKPPTSSFIIIPFWFLGEERDVEEWGKGGNGE